MRRYGDEGLRLCAAGARQDDREVDPERETKSVSAETTFDDDIADARRARADAAGACPRRCRARLKPRRLRRLDASR